MPSRKAGNRILLCLVLVCLSCLLLWRVIEASGYFALKRIDVIGHETLTPRQVEDIAGLYKGILLLGLNLGVAEQRLLSDQRIVSATIIRILPDRLKVVIEEDIGVGVFTYHDRFVEFDRHLRVVSLVADFSKVNLPIVTGVSMTQVKLGDTLTHSGIASARDVITMIPPVLRGLISEVNVADLRRMYLYTNEGVKIDIGELAGMAQRLALLPAALYAYELREFSPDTVPIIDLSGSIAVFRGK